MDPLELFDHVVVFRRDKIRTHDETVAVDELFNSIVDDLNEALKQRTTCITKIDLPINKEFLPAIGIRLSGQSSSAILTRGPQSGSESGDAFRKFWSSKSELRRIDGDLYECVVWSEKENVCKQIVDFVLQSRFKLSRGAFAHWAWNQITPDRLDAVLSFNPNLDASETSIATSLRLVRAMDKLRGLLRGLNDKLPLDVTGVLPISSAFRDTSVFPPLITIPSTLSHQCGGVNRSSPIEGNSQKTPIFPLYVVVTLEQSGKWPDEWESFMHMKRLMVIRIHELLTPMGIPSHVTADCMLDIFLDGLVFRISIAQPRELRLLQKTTTVPDTLEANAKPGFKRNTSTSSPSNTQCVDNPASLAWARLNQSMPTICGMLAAVARSEAHVFPVACRLAKRWLSAHGYPVVLCPFQAEMDGLRQLNYDIAVARSKPNKSGVTNHRRQIASFGPSTVDCAGRLTEIAVELLVLYAAGFSTPVEQRSEVTDGVTSIRVASGSPVAAFLRFLRLLATHDWDQRPLLIDLNEGFSDMQKRRAALSCFEAGRERLPAMVLCTPLDPSGSEWTTLGPTRSGLHVLQKLAAQSRSLLRAMLVAGAKFRELKSVFRPGQQNLDVLLTLKPEIVGVRSGESIDYYTDRKRLGAGLYLQTTKSSLWTSATENELPTEIPPPGARFWPANYCYDPLNSVARLFQIHLGRYCDVLWDRYGGNWIGLRWRPTIGTSKGTHSEHLFARHTLDGVVVHKPSKTGTQMTVVHKLPRLLRLLSDWSSEFVDRVQGLSLSADTVTGKKRLSKRKRVVAKRKSPIAV